MSGEDTSTIFLRLPPEQEMALEQLNQIIIGLNEGQVLSADCLGTRLGALREYCDGKRSVMALANAFKSLYPHWPHSNSPVKAITNIMKLLYSAAWISCAESHQFRIPVAKYQTKENLSIPLNPRMILKRRCCVIHPDRRVHFKRLGLCQGCYQKGAEARYSTYDHTPD